jgi:cold-inducible RNA-binding protein
MKIFVENLPSDITEEGLKGVFAQVGAVESVKIKTELLTGRPSGSGYVEMYLDVDAFRAVNCLNGSTMKDRRITLKEAQPLLARAKRILEQSINRQGLKPGFNKRKNRLDH